MLTDPLRAYIAEIHKRKESVVMHLVRKLRYRNAFWLIIIACMFFASTSSAFAAQRTTTAPRLALSASVRLDPNLTDHVQEPGPTGTDAQGNAYTDPNLSQNCGPGASTVSLAFWQSFGPQGLHPYEDPYHGGTTTWWDDTENHAFIMYLATEAPRPSDGGVGEIRYDSNGNSLGTDALDMVSVLNAVAHTGFYIRTIIGSGDAKLVHQDIVSDLTNTSVAGSLGKGIPPIAEVRAQELPDWHTTSGTTNHFIAIVGYDDNAGTYTYIETCGPQCGGQFGPHTISQSQLFHAILDTINTNGSNDHSLVW